MRFSRAAAYPRMCGNANLPRTIINTPKMMTVQNMTFVVNEKTFGSAAAPVLSWSTKLNKFIPSLPVDGVTAQRAATRIPWLLLDQERDNQTEQCNTFDERCENDRRCLDIA